MVIISVKTDELFKIYWRRNFQKVSKTWIFGKISFCFNKKESYSEEVFFNQFVFRSTAFRLNTFPLLQVTVTGRRLNNKVSLHPYKKMNTYLQLCIWNEWAWKRRERNTKDISFERTFQAVQNRLFIKVFLILFILKKYPFLSTSSYKIRFFHSVRFVSLQRYELESWDLVWQWDTHTHRGDKYTYRLPPSLI
jgi:hypothetical protein